MANPIELWPTLVLYDLLTRCRVVIADVEWVVPSGDGDEHRFCPICEGCVCEPAQHENDCKLAAVKRDLEALP